MPYGLYVENAGNRIQIDSDAVYSNMYIRDVGVSTTGTLITTAPENFSLSSGEMLFARPATSYGMVGLTNTTWHTSNSTNIGWFVAKPIKEAPAPVGNYGLQVYNSLEQVIFDSRLITQGFDILAFGTLNTALTLDINIPVDILMTDVYCFMNSTAILTSEGSSYPEDLQVGYFYDGQTVKLQNYRNIIETPGQPPVLQIGRDFSYMVVARRRS